MTEPTAEQIEAERERAHAATRCEGVEDLDHDGICDAVATALASVRIEAHAAFEQALTAKAGDTVGGYFLVRKAVSNGCFGWWVSGPGIGAEGFISLPNLIAAIRALRGRT